MSPLALLGQVDIELENEQALSQPIGITGSWNHDNSKGDFKITKQ